MNERLINVQEFGAILGVAGPALHYLILDQCESLITSKTIR